MRVKVPNVEVGRGGRWPEIQVQVGIGEVVVWCKVGMTTRSTG